MLPPVGRGRVAVLEYLMPTIAVIGAGFTGSMVATHVLRFGGDEQVLLVDRGGRFGPGVAYGTACGAHLLNVPAGRMSALEDDPEHFVRWAQGVDPQIRGASFVPRMLYGQYVEAVLAEAERASGGRLRRIAQPVLTVGPIAGGIELGLPGSRIAVDHAVLAIGNAPPSNPPLEDAGFFQSARYTRDPWSGEQLVGVDASAAVLLIGTGLTMMDIALELVSRGHRGPMVAISRRGLLSQPHRAHAKPYHRDRPGDLDLWPSTARGLLKKVRLAVREAMGKGVDWREVVTSLRADTPRLWGRLPLVERQRFMRHIRPYWDTHRHRAAPETWAGIERLLESGQLRIEAGRLLSMVDAGDAVRVVYRPRGASATAELSVGHVVNCTGPETDPRRVADPLVSDLLSRGIAAVDPLGLGLESTPEYRVMAADGSVWDRLWIAGPLQRPLYWETTAVPELRVHALRCAERVLERCRLGERESRGTALRGV